MQILYWLLFAEIVIFVAVFAIQIYVVLKINKRVNIVLNNISCSIPKVKFRFIDIVSTFPFAVIPILNFIYLTIICLNMDKIISLTEKEIVKMKVDNYSNLCKKRRESLEKLVEILKNKE